MPIYGGFHFSVMIVVNPGVVALPLDEDSTTEPAWLLLYDSFGMHAVGGNAFKNMTNLLGMAFEKEHGNRTIEEMKARLGRFKPHVMEEDVCALAEGRLIGKLTAAGHEIPPGNEIRKPPELEVIGDEVEDREWRAEMAEQMHRLEVRNESQAVAIAKLERQLRELMLSRTPQPGIGGVDTGEGHGDVGGDATGEGHVDVGGDATGEGHGDAGGDAVGEGHGDVGGNNAGTHDSMRGAHGEGPVADVETGVGGNNSKLEKDADGDMADGARRDNEEVGVRDEGAKGLLGTTDGNIGAREAVDAGHGVTASNADVDLVSAHSIGTETTSRNTARGQAPSSGYTGVTKREGRWAARLCVDSAKSKFLVLGRYTEILDAAKAYAAAAHICRPSLSSSTMVELSVEERQCLEGLTTHGVARIVEAKRWAEWRNWREVLGSLPEPSIPTPAGVHTQAPPPFSHQHPGATFGNYHSLAAAFAGHAGATLNPGAWQLYNQSHPPPNLHFPSQQFAFNQIPNHPFGQVQAPIAVHPTPSVPIAPNPVGHAVKKAGFDDEAKVLGDLLSQAEKKDSSAAEAQAMEDGWESARRMDGKVQGRMDGNVEDGWESARRMDGKVQGRMDGKVQGRMDGNVQGRMDGKVQGRMDGNVQGRMDGNVQGRMDGNVQGRMDGKVQGRMDGNVQGRMDGNVQGRMDGNVQGRMDGNVQGRMDGNVQGRMDGNVQGRMDGNVQGGWMGMCKGGWMGMRKGGWMGMCKEDGWECAREDGWECARRMDGNVQGRMDGNVQGRMDGNVQGRMDGNVQGRMDGNVQGRMDGNVQGRMDGNVQGRMDGNVQGRMDGNAQGRMDGNVQGGWMGMCKGGWMGKCKEDGWESARRMDGNVQGRMDGKVQGGWMGMCNGGWMGMCKGGWMGMCKGGWMGMCKGGWMGMCKGGWMGMCKGGWMGMCKGGWMGMCKEDGWECAREDGWECAREDGWECAREDGWECAREDGWE
ncbi:unnamed protein product [Closterium sp. NIES-64]|nr:unnamed protein product [Closterium sp. NIES-64]